MDSHRMACYWNSLLLFSGLLWSGLSSRGSHAFYTFYVTTNTARLTLLKGLASVVILFSHSYSPAHKGNHKGLDRRTCCPTIPCLWSPKNIMAEIPTPVLQVQGKWKETNNKHHAWGNISLTSLTQMQEVHSTWDFSLLMNQRCEQDIMGRQWLRRQEQSSAQSLSKTPKPIAPDELVGALHGSRSPLVLTSCSVAYNKTLTKKPIFCWD